jgi:hypothetical protein
VGTVVVVGGVVAEGAVVAVDVGPVVAMAVAAAVTVAGGVAVSLGWGVGEAGSVGVSVGGRAVDVSVSPGEATTAASVAGGAWVLPQLASIRVRAMETAEKRNVRVLPFIRTSKE